MKKLNCVNVPCPQPIVLCKEILKSENINHLEVTVDNQAAKENVCRFLHSKDFEISIVQKNNLWILTALKNKTENQITSEQEPTPTNSPKNGLKTVIMLSDNKIGSDSTKLGEKIMKMFLSTLPEMESELWKVVLVHGAVKLATVDSFAISELQQLINCGVEILVCGACLEFYQLINKKQIGQTTNMLDIVTSLQLADKVITF